MGVLWRVFGGFTVGLVGIFGVLSESTYSSYHTNLYTPVYVTLTTLIRHVRRYSPTQLHKQQAQEGLALSGDIPAQNLQFNSELESPEEQRKRIRFLNEIRERIRRAELSAAQRGVPLRERKQIIREVISEFYPEVSPLATDELLSKIQRNSP